VFEMLSVCLLLIGLNSDRRCHEAELFNVDGGDEIPEL
jgi:hypothetical protein